MKKPQLSFYGQISAPFTIYLKSLKVLENIRSGKIKPSRALCYPAETLGDEFMLALSYQLEVNPARMIMEIYVPDGEYPAHTDGGGESFMVPLEHNCTATIGGITHQLKSWGIYSFDSEKPHATTGGMLMMTRIDKE